MESVSKKNDQNNKEVIVVEDHGENMNKKSKNLELDLMLAPTKELDVAGSSKQPGPKDNRVFSCKYCRRKFESSQALGGHHNAHRHERRPVRKGFIDPMYLGLPYRHHLMYSSSSMSPSSNFSPFQAHLERSYGMLRMHSSMGKMSYTPWSALRHNHGSHIGGWPSHSSASSTSLVQNNANISSQLPINNISPNSTGTGFRTTGLLLNENASYNAAIKGGLQQQAQGMVPILRLNSNFGSNIGVGVSADVAAEIPFTTNPIAGNNNINQQFNGDYNILKSFGGHVADPKETMQEVEQELDLTLKL